MAQAAPHKTRLRNISTHCHKAVAHMLQLLNSAQCSQLLQHVTQADLQRAPQRALMLLLVCWGTSTVSSMLDVITVAAPRITVATPRGCELHAPSMASLGVLKPRPTFLYQRRPPLPGILTLAAVFLILHRAK
jgi:hypothetical protein